MSTTYAGVNAFPASLTIPSDGDAAVAASVNVPLEGLTDRTTYLRSRIGNYSLVDIQFVAVSALPINTETVDDHADWIGTTFSSPFQIINVDPGIAAYTPALGDFVETIVQLTASLSGTAGNAWLRLVDNQNSTGNVELPGCKSYMHDAGILYPIGFAGCRVITTAGPYKVSVEGRATSGTVSFFGSYSCLVKVWRPSVL